MSKIFGQPPYFDYSSPLTAQLTFKYGDDLVVEPGFMNQTAGFKNRKYIFNYDNSIFILNKITQSGRERQREDPNDYMISNPYQRTSLIYHYTPTSVTDINNINNQMTFVNNIVYNNESLPEPITQNLLFYLFKFPNNKYQYFLDTENYMNILKAGKLGANSYTVKTNIIKILRYGLLENNNAILIKQTF